MILTSVRSISMDTDQSTLALNTVLRLPEAKPEDKKVRTEGLQALSLDLFTRLTGYQKELGPNAYAVFNTLTDIAARPPENAYFQKDRDTIEKRSGRRSGDTGGRVGYGSHRQRHLHSPECRPHQTSRPVIRYFSTALLQQPLIRLQPGQFATLPWPHTLQVLPSEVTHLKILKSTSDHVRFVAV
jgi:hypothetical protein